MRTFLTATGILLLLLASNRTIAGPRRMMPTLVIAEDPLTTSSEDEICSVAFSPDGSAVASKLYTSDFLETEGLILWDVMKGSLVKGFEFAPGGIYSIKFGPYGRTIGLPFGQIYDLQTGETLKLGTPEDRIFSIAFSPEGKIVASTDRDSVGKITLWEATTGHSLGILKSDVKTGKRLLFSRDGRTLVSAGADVLQFWNIESRQLVRTIKLECGYYDELAYNDNARQIAVSECDKERESIALIDPQSGQRIGQLDGHTSGIWSLDLSPDGRFLVSSGVDLTIKLWDLSTRRLLRTFKGHSKIIRTVAFSPDSQTIVSGGGYNETKVWSIASGKLIATFRPFKDGNWIVYTPDGYYNRSGGAAKYIRWRLGEKLLDESEYRSLFFQPQVVAQRLRAKF